MEFAEIAATAVGEVDRRAPVRVSPDTSVASVVAKLREHNRGAVLVEDDTGIVGIFSERDLMKRVDHSSPDWRARPVSDFMTPEPRTIGASETIGAAIRLMVGGRYRHLPLVDRAGKVIGIVSIRDFLGHIVSFFPKEFINLPTAPEDGASKPWGG